MSDRRLTRLFEDHAPAAPTAAESAAALDAARPGFLAARARRRSGLAGATLVTFLIVGGALLSRDGADRTNEVASPTPSSTTTAPDEADLPVETEHFDTPGGSVDATIDAGELTLVASMAADGYIAMVEVMTSDRLEVSFSGPDRHVIALTVDADGMIVEVATDARPTTTTTTPPSTPPSSTTPPAAPSSSTPPPSTTPPSTAPPSTTSSLPATTPTTTTPPTTEPDGPHDDEEAGSGWRWDEWDWPPPEGWSWPPGDWDWPWDWGPGNNGNAGNNGNGNGGNGNGNGNGGNSADDDDTDDDDDDD